MTNIEIRNGMSPDAAMPMRGSCSLYISGFEIRISRISRDGREKSGGGLIT